MVKLRVHLKYVINDNYRDNETYIKIMLKYISFIKIYFGLHTTHGVQQLYAGR